MHDIRIQDSAGGKEKKEQQKFMWELLQLCFCICSQLYYENSHNIRADTNLWYCDFEAKVWIYSSATTIFLQSIIISNF